MSEANVKNPKDDSAPARSENRTAAIAQDVFNDMVKASRLGHSDRSKPALDAEHILAGLSGNSFDRQAVFNALAADVKNSGMMKKYGLSVSVMTDATGNVEGLVFSSTANKANSINLEINAKDAAATRPTGDSAGDQSKTADLQFGKDRFTLFKPAHTSDSSTVNLIYVQSWLHPGESDLYRLPAVNNPKAH